jgi:sugar phosphate isomerase/epimerase
MRWKEGAMFSRRLFLGGLGAAVPASAGKPIDRTRLSAITDEIGKSPHEAIQFARQYRLRWVELREVPGSKGKHYASLTEPELQAAAREFADNGLKVSFLNAGLLKHTLPGTEPANPRHRQPDAQERFDRRMDDLRKAIHSAHVLGVDKVRVFAFSRVQDPAALMPRIADIIGEMGEVAAREKIHLLVENEVSCNVATCSELAELMRLLPSRSIGINWDPLNGTHFKENPMPDGYSKLPRKRIGNVQIKGRSILPGPQQLDWAAIFKALAGDNYKGQCGLETHIFGELQVHYSHESMKALLAITETASTTT